MTVTKATIARSIEKQINVSTKESVSIVETLLELIKKSLESGDDVMISRFGKFTVNEKKERKGRNPANGSDMMLRARRVVTFRCSGKLRDKINDK